MEHAKERDFLFDNIKGVLIFCVVYAHFLHATTFELATWGGAIYSTFFCFIMQVFLFVSGYFSKKVDKCRATSVEVFLFPYVVLTVIMYFMRVLIFGGEHASLHFIKPSMALWYLLVLFFYRYFIKDLAKIPYLLPISIVISLLSGLVPFLNENLSLGRVFGFLPFFVGGYLCTPAHLEKMRQIPKGISVPLLLILPAFGGVIAYTGIGWHSILFKRSYASEGLGAMQGLFERGGLMLIALAWIIIFVSLLPRTKTFFSSIGQGTMTVFILHIIIRYEIKATKIFGQQDVYSYFCLLLCTAATIWFFSRPWVIDVYNWCLGFLYRGIPWMIEKVYHSSKKFVLPRSFDH